MKTDFIYALTNNFEEHAQKTEDGVEFWLARELQQLLGYEEWRNFHNVIDKAKTVCVNSGHNVTGHFVDVNKMVDLNLCSFNCTIFSYGSKLAISVVRKNRTTENLYRFADVNKTFILNLTNINFRQLDIKNKLDKITPL